MLSRCRNLKIEPPGRTERIVRGCRARFERTFCERMTGCLSADSTAALLELATGADGSLAELKADPGRLGLETLLEEIVKLRRSKALGLPADLFGEFSDKLVASWRARAMASHPSDFAANPEPVRLTLLAALAWCRTAEITDLVQSLLNDPAWAERLTDADRRALSPLFWSHANLYGTFHIDMDTHLDLGLAA
ncbi:hypothetical protein [Nonomuraea aurantiaca]|uniref:hypothetical protein n=1 Tax=Nonomuraea aurantiaca TaxID=2878562 RepID=UPI001CD9D4C6|nr:hypothetical protein [Nonomuraea aurantiaca]MCA2230463.1 hypothetical protein [Nonomuraea aurantiaca]